MFEKNYIIKKSKICLGCGSTDKKCKTVEEMYNCNLNIYSKRDKKKSDE